MAVWGTTDDAHRTARDLAEAGVSVVALMDARPGPLAGDGTTRGAYGVLTGARVTGTRGRLGLRSIRVEHERGSEELEVDCLAVSGGWSPAVHLTCHLERARSGTSGCRRTSPATARCRASPWRAAQPAISRWRTASLRRTRGGGGACGPRDRRHAPPVPDADGEGTPPGPLVTVPGARAFVDFQNDVTVKDIRLSAQEGFTSVEHMKRYTTLGMATDQGKTANVPGLAVLSEALGSPIAATGTTTFRPPFVPVSIAALGAAARAMASRPSGSPTRHAASVARGAPMIEAGLWFRPSYFPAPGEVTWRQACDREVGMVRGRVGVAGVSTLGKIDVQGPDAAAFLDFVYANTISTLPVGRVRYGLMLREDGHVMDDGPAPGSRTRITWSPPRPPPRAS